MYISIVDKSAPARVPCPTWTTQQEPNRVNQALPKSFTRGVRTKTGKGSKIATTKYSLGHFTGVFAKITRLNNEALQ